MTARVRVARGTDHGVHGFVVTGVDVRGRAIRVFTLVEATAREVVSAIKLGDDAEVSRVLLAEEQV